MPTRAYSALAPFVRRPPAPAASRRHTSSVAKPLAVSGSTVRVACAAAHLQRRQGKEVYNRETRRVQRLHTIYTRTPEVYWTKQDVLERIRSKASKGATSAPGLGPPLPHLHRDWAHPLPRLHRE
jgi:hypothetical protein